MILPLFIVPLAIHLLPIADGVPKLDVSGSCRGAVFGIAASEAGERMRSCFASEERTRDALSKTWADYTAADRTYCVGSIKGFEPTYTELATCLEMQQNLKKSKSPASTARP